MQDFLLFILIFVKKAKIADKGKPFSHDEEKAFILILSIAKLLSSLV